MASDLRSEISSDASVESEVETKAASGSAADTAVSAVSANSDSASIASPSAEASGDSISRPDLNLVSSSTSTGNSTDETNAEPDSAQDSGRRGIPLWIALVGLVVAALIVGYQMRINGQLEAEVTGLEAKLGRTEAVLDAHKSHLGDIRGGVRDLSARLQNLQALVETEPVAARDASEAAQP